MKKKNRLNDECRNKKSICLYESIDMNRFRSFHAYSSLLVIPISEIKSRLLESICIWKSILTNNLYLVSLRLLVCYINVNINRTNNTPF